VAGALALHEERLRIFEQLGDVRSRAVTQCDLADLLRAKGQVAEAVELYRASLETCRRITYTQGVCALLVRLGEVALEQGQRDEAVSLLQEARRGFEQLGVQSQIDRVDRLLALAQGKALTLDGLLAMIRAARHGDQEAAQRAWEICSALAQSGDAALADLGERLRKILDGASLDSAVAGLPDSLRAQILEALNDPE
jgi:tetratricopeptide (TPR) repeat protein